MKTVDYRSFLVKYFSRPDHLPNPPGVLESWMGELVDGIVQRRVSKRPSAPKGPLLVSVGNLALGGTGKTPVVMALVQGLDAMGIKGAILTRGYGSSLTSPLVVEAGNRRAGDEARMMAQHLSELSWPVVQSRNRPLGLNFIAGLSMPIDVVILEDAHQTAKLPRHLDLLILDSWDNITQKDSQVLIPRTGPVFPFGPWRESASGAERAAALLIESKDNQVDKSISGQSVFSFGRTVKLRLVKGELGVGGQSWALLSGIARPQKFENSAKGCLENPVVLAVRCRDHEDYSEKLVAGVVGEMDSAGATGLVTTAKDWIKLSLLWSDTRPVLILALDLVWTKENALNHWLVERINENSSHPINRP